MRRSVLLAVVLVAAACSSAEPAVNTEVDGRSIELARLDDAIAEVADEQEDVDPVLADDLETLGEADRFVAAMRDPERMDDVRDDVAAVQAAVDTIDPETAREELIDVAVVVDRARADIRRALDTLDDPWEQEYLQAQDQVLAAVRSYAEASDALAQILARHLPTYTDVLDATANFVEQRWFYRSSEEAADAYEVEIDRYLRPLATAREQIARYAERREEAAAAVNEAGDAAAEVWEERPRDGPTGGGSAASPP